MERLRSLVEANPVAISDEPDDCPPAATSDAPLLPIPSSTVGGTEIELAILWVRGLQDDRRAERDRSALEERRMIEAGRQRIEQLRDKAQDEWSAAIARGVGGIVGGGLQVVGAVVPTRGAPSAEQGAREAAAKAHKVDWSGAANGSGASFQGSAGLWGGAYDRRAGEHEAEAAEYETDRDVAERRADRARAVQADVDDSIDRTIALLKETLAAQNAAQNAAVRS